MVQRFTGVGGMNNTKTGGPAFPQAYAHTAVVTKMYESGELTAGQLKQASSQLAGMTLRDYFAAKAMQSYIADSNWRAESPNAETARAAYMVADAMLKAREA
jgi:hypothetical protein